MGRACWALWGKPLPARAGRAPYNRGLGIDHDRCQRISAWGVFRTVLGGGSPQASSAPPAAPAQPAPGFFEKCPTKSQVETTTELVSAGRGRGWLRVALHATSHGAIGKHDATSLPQPKKAPCLDRHLPYGQLRHLPPTPRQHRHRSARCRATRAASNAMNTHHAPRGHGRDHGADGLRRHQRHLEHRNRGPARTPPTQRHNTPPAPTTGSQPHPSIAPSARTTQPPRAHPPRHARPSP